MDKFRLDWTYHSNAEGNTLTYGETPAFLLHGITAAGKPFRDYLDVKGHHAALTLKKRYLVTDLLELDFIDTDTGRTLCTIRSGEDRCVAMR